MDTGTCSDVIIKLSAVVVYAITPENEYFTHKSRLTETILVQNGLFPLFFTVLDLSWPLEGSYGRCFVLGCDNQVVYGGCVHSST